MALYWQDDNDKNEPYKVPDDIIDLSFKLKCRSLPLDHSQALSDAIHKALPWMDKEALAAIHCIHVAESGNGWIRPEDPDNDVLYLSKRTRMTLRLPKERIEAAKTLKGQSLDVAGNTLEIGEATTKELSKLTTIFSRYVVAEQVEDEEAFLEEVFGHLVALGIKPKKMMSGRQHRIRSSQGDLVSRTLMLAELDVEQSVLLQQQGLGPARKLGCGIFLPHKGIEAVNQSQEKE